MREKFYRIKHKILKAYYVEIKYNFEIKFNSDIKSLQSVYMIARPLFPIYKKSYFTSWTRKESAINHIKKIIELNKNAKYIPCLTNPNFIELEECSINKTEVIDFKKYI